MRFCVIRTKVERKIASTEATMARIDDNPKPKQDQMQVNKRHASGKRSNPVSHPSTEGPPLLFLLTARDQDCDVALDDFSQFSGGVVLAGLAWRIIHKIYS